MKAKRRRSAELAMARKIARRAMPPAKPANALVVGFAWYRESQWRRLHELSADASGLHELYGDWLRQAQSSLRQLRAQGLDVEPVEIDVEAAAEWAAQRGEPFTGRSRSEYVRELVAAGHRRPKAQKQGRTTLGARRRRARG